MIIFTSTSSILTMGFVSFVFVTSYLLFMGIKPFFVPFNVFKFLCSIGRKASISENFELFKDNFTYEYKDERYNVWRHELKARNSLSEAENLALARQTLREITAEIKRREFKARERNMNDTNNTRPG